MKKLLLFVIACTLGLFGTVSAQETITIGDGSAGENYAPPIDFYYSNAISQQIFSASSLEIPSGSVISKIAFKRSGGSAPKRNWSIYMQNSEAGEGGEDVEEPETPEVPTFNGHEYVDLGLSVKWATCNVGATTPEEYGDYFAWGETTTKTGYTEGNCPTSGLSYSELQSQGCIDGEGNLTAQYDAAAANWGGNWRMPTKAELQELIDKCTWTWTTQNGVKGYKVTSKTNGNSIFLPAAGYRFESSLKYAGSDGRYFSSTPSKTDDDLAAYSLTFFSSYHGRYDHGRANGMSVRPVSGGGFEGPAAQYASVETAEVTEIKATSAVCGGNVTTDGGVEVTARGICWNTTGTPTIGDNKTTNGSGLGSFTSNLSNLASQTTYYVRAYATNEVGTAYGEEVSFTTLEGTFENGHEYVDLGLSVKWATCNVGATTPEEYGDYFAWGETTTKTGYTEGNCPTSGLSYSELQSQGCIDGEGNLTAQYDAAAANWGGNWRMPTEAEQQELIDECTWTWTTQNGVKGCKVTSKTNGNSIFLPVAGSRFESSLIDAGSDGRYFSSTPRERLDNDRRAYSLSFDCSIHGVGSCRRYDGQPVRPVSGGGFEGPEAQCASVETVEVTEIKATSAVCGGNVTTDGGVEVTARGVCWSTSQNPTIEDNKTTDGNGVGSFTSQIPNLVPNTQYYVRAYATNEVGTSYGEEVSFTTLEGTFENGHEYVDLGLPSGLLWATCNVGATTPEEYGDYFAWGETTTKETYTEDNCATYNVSMNDISGNAQYDAATANWGGDWRMPTKNELNELINNCTWTWITQNGVNGYNVEGPNGNSIFLPAVGYRYGSSPTAAGSKGYFWSSAPYDPDDDIAYRLYFNSNTLRMSDCHRYYGLSVRPVSGGGFEGPAAQYASVETAEVTEIKATSAVCGGNVTTDGGVEVTARGVCWSTSQNPTIEDNKTTDGTGVGIFTSQIPNLVPNTQYYVRAYATNEVGTSYGEEVSFTTLERNANGHEYVDLGLSVKWATCNVGATSPEEYGDYFAWGETSTKETYDSDNCPTYGLTKSELQSQGYIDSEGNLNPQYDAATANWGGDWRMPTRAEQQELLNNCTWTWTTQNGVNGYNVEGPNGNSIFLPAAGYRDGSSLYRAGSYVYYWSSTPFEDGDYRAYFLYFSSSGHGMGYYSRNNGLSVRPVSGGGFEGPVAQYASVETAEVTEIKATSAVCGGEVTFDGNVSVTVRGVCWSTSQNPTIEDNKTTDGSGVGIFTSQIPNLVPNTQYYVRAYATNEVGTAYGEEVAFTTLERNANGHTYVDLGLPSGLLWATCNVGATTPEEYGDHFAWGETSTKETYDYDNCPTYGLSISQLQSQGYIDSEGNLTSQYDAATANWGGDWRMPTYAELNELNTKCTWTWTTQNGVNGYNVEGPNGNSIFLPAAGNRYGSSLTYAGGSGYYWSSTPKESYYGSAYFLGVYSDSLNMYDYGSRYEGLSVRPVSGGGFEGPEAPNAPVVTATAQDATTIVLAMETFEVEKYNIYQGEELVATTTENTYTVSGLEANTEYCFTVTAENAVGVSAASAEVCATTLMLAPEAPANLVVTSVGEMSVDLAWEASERAESYNIYQDGDVVATTTETSYKIGGLTPETEYCFTVSAINNGGETVSETVCTTTEVFTGCYITFTLTDSWGDGWNNNYLTVEYDGISQTIEFPAVLGGRNDKTMTEIVPLPQYADVTVTYEKAGSWPEENSFVITYENGNEILNIAQGSLSETTSWEFVVDCTPAVPENLVAETIDAATIELTWDAIANEYVTYNVYNDTVLVANVDTTIFIVEGLEPFTEYCFTVTSVNRADESEKSVEACAKTLDLVIAAPENLVAEATSISTIVLTWEAVENALSYNVYNDTVLVANVTDTTFTVEGLASYTDYSFTVSAVRNEQEVVSEVASARTLDLVVAEPVVTAEAVSASSIVLTWPTAENAMSYNVYSIDIDTIFIETVLADSTYTIVDLDPYKDYCYTVSAVRNEQEIFSEAACAKTLDLVITAPENVLAEATSISTIVLTWNAVENALNYNVYQGEEVIANVTSTTYKVEGLEINTDYCFNVTAVRNVQETEKVEACAKTQKPVPAAPANLVAEAISETSIALTWESVEYASSYTVYQGEDSIANVTETTFVVEGLDPFADYCFTVTAANEFGESAKSVEACAKTLDLVIAAPANLVAKVETSSSIVLTWNAVEGATSYNVYNDTVLVENVTDTVYVVTGLETATEYCFTVTAVNEAGESEASEKACATTLPEGVAEAEFSFTIYPNPVDNMLTIDTDSYIEEVTIYSLTGVMMYKEVDFNNHTIDVSDFSCGVYVMKVRTDNGESVKRFIKK